MHMRNGLLHMDTEAAQMRKGPLRMNAEAIPMCHGRLRMITEAIPMGYGRLRMTTEPIPMGNGRLRMRKGLQRMHIRRLPMSDEPRIMIKNAVGTLPHRPGVAELRPPWPTTLCPKSLQMLTALS